MKIQLSTSLLSELLAASVVAMIHRLQTDDAT